MTDGRISGQILKAVKAAAEADPLAQDFLSELLFMEAERGRQWRWKEVYRGKIREYTNPEGHRR